MRTTTGSPTSLLTTFRALNACPRGGSENLSRALGSFLGGAIGDALGAPEEFVACQPATTGAPIPEIKMRDTKNSCLQLDAGQYTDDFSQALCLTFAFKAGHFDPKLFMENICRWYYYGKFASSPRAVGLGANVSAAIHNYLWMVAFTPEWKDWYQRQCVIELNNKATSTQPGDLAAKSLAIAIRTEMETKGMAVFEPTEAPVTAEDGYQCQARMGNRKWPHGIGDALLTFDGNAATMRVSPVAVFARDLSEAMLIAAQQSYVTTKGKQAADCARLIAFLSYKAIHEPRKAGETPSAFKARLISAESLNEFIVMASKQVIFAKVLGLDRELEQMLRRESFEKDPVRSTSPWWNWWKARSDCRMGDGYFGSYVMDNIAIVLHALQSTTNFRDAVAQTVLRRGDADTNAAVVGTVAGAIYGLEAIPEHWVEAVSRHSVNDGQNGKLEQNILDIGLHLYSQNHAEKVSTDLALNSAEDAESDHRSRLGR